MFPAVVGHPQQLCLSIAERQYIANATLFTVMFPLTIVEIHAGAIFGKERIVVTRVGATASAIAWNC